MLHVSSVDFTPPGAASAPAGRPSQTPSVGANSQTVANPPNRAKLHHGSASLPECRPLSPRAAFCLLSEWPTVRWAKIEAARAGVIVMALIADITIDAEMVRANWRNN